jgi:hypothetical protein
MRNTGIPKGATLVYQASANRESDNAKVSVFAYLQNDTLYAAWLLNGKRVVRRQYSGRNVKELREELKDMDDYPGRVEEVNKLSQIKPSLLEW